MSAQELVVASPRHEDAHWRSGQVLRRTRQRRAGVRVRVSACGWRGRDAPSGWPRRCETTERAHRSRTPRRTGLTSDGQRSPRRRSVGVQRYDRRVRASATEIRRRRRAWRGRARSVPERTTERGAGQRQYERSSACAWWSRGGACHDTPAPVGRAHRRAPGGHRGDMPTSGIRCSSAGVPPSSCPCGSADIPCRRRPAGRSPGGTAGGLSAGCTLVGDGELTMCSPGGSSPGSRRCPAGISHLFSGP